MPALTYEQYCEHYARQCDNCKGKRRYKIDGNWTACPCQQKAALKFRFESIPIQPEELKRLTWKDFTGRVPKKGSVISGNAYQSARKTLLGYCFNSNDEKAILSNDFDVMQERRRLYSCVLDHLQDGQNLAIFGGSETGKSLLAMIVIKEVIYASLVFGRPNVSFRWTRGSELLHAVTWDGEGKTVDEAFMWDLVATDYLVIDDVYLERKGHSRAPDVVELDRLFSERMIRSRPTIIVGEPEIATCVLGNGGNDIMAKKNLRKTLIHSWGISFFKLLSDKKTTLLHLEKGKG